MKPISLLSILKMCLHIDKLIPKNYVNFFHDKNKTNKKYIFLGQ